MARISNFSLEIELDSSWVYLAAGAVFFIGVIVYVAFMIFLPEWVGISGKVAREAEASHRGDPQPEAPSVSKVSDQNENRNS